jgi:putative transposase
VRADAQGLTPAVRRQSAEQAEIARLRRELRRVEEERDILKRAGGVLREPPPKRFVFVSREEPNHAIARLCSAVEVSRSGYYAWRRSRGATACT